MMFGTLVGWLLFASLVAVLGAVALRWISAAADVPAHIPGDWLADRAARIGRTAALVLGVALALLFVRQLLQFHDPFVPWTDDARLLLLGTSWGHLWIAALLCALGAAGALALAAGVPGVAARGRSLAWAVATALTLALGAYPAVTGHANATEELRPLTLASDALHVWAAGTWIGSLGALIWLERSWRRERVTPASLLPDLVPAFSRVALICGGLLVVTGVLAAWVHLSSVGALVETPYGRRLVLKVALAAGVYALGALNWRRLKPRLREPAGQEALRRSAVLELVVAQGVLLATAFLIAVSPIDR
jgi:copper transport protein